MNIEFEITTKGYAMEDKLVKKSSPSSCSVYLPKEWLGKKVRVILLEPLTMVADDNME